MNRSVWQVSGGPSFRPCADVFLKYGVGLIGPRDAGPWNPERDDHEFDLPAEASAQAGATTLDRVHMAMLLQAGGQTNALRALLKGEQERGPGFLRLASALSALYPRGSEEKRLLNAMLLAVPR